jgi:hypothetical protein
MLDPALTSTSEYHLRATELLSKVFVDDPVFRYLLSDFNENERLAYLPKYMHVMFKAAQLNGASFMEAK